MSLRTSCFINRTKSTSVIITEIRNWHHASRHGSRSRLEDVDVATRRGADPIDCRGGKLCDVVRWHVINDVIGWRRQTGSAVQSRACVESYAYFCRRRKKSTELYLYLYLGQCKKSSVCVSVCRSSNLTLSSGLAIIFWPLTFERISRVSLTMHKLCSQYELSTLIRSRSTSSTANRRAGLKCNINLTHQFYWSSINVVLFYASNSLKTVS